jgi:hypothetical protein
MSGEQSLTILFPQPRQMTLAGQPVFVGKLKLRQKAELQHWLDGLPEPNPRIRAELDGTGLKGWPISVADLPILMDVDFDSRVVFLSIALAPFNPGLTSEQIATLAGEVTDEEEFVRVMLVAYGHDPDALQKRKAAPIDPKEEDAVRSFS